MPKRRLYGTSHWLVNAMLCASFSQKLFTYPLDGPKHLRRERQRDAHDSPWVAAILESSLQIDGQYMVYYRNPVWKFQK